MYNSRPYHAFLLAVVATFLATPAFAQSTEQTPGEEAYPWRLNNSPVKSVQPVSSTAVTPAILPGQLPPAPPRIGLEEAVNARQDQDAEKKSAEQPEAQLGTPPAAPGSDVYKDVVQPEPALDVQSNATSEDANYCFRAKPQWCDLGCTKRLFKRPVAGFDVGGFAQFGYHNRNILPFNNTRRDRFNLHQTWFHFDKQTWTPSGYGVRYRLDTVYGLDAQKLQAVGNRTTGTPDGWDNDWDSGSFGWAVPQAFVEITSGEWQYKIGKFLSPIGYEAAPSTENFFFSRTYTRAFTEPFSHTGLLAQRNLSESTTQILGVTAGWDSAFESNSSGFNILTGMRFQPNAHTTLTTTSSLGDTGYRGSGSLWSGVAEVQLTSKIQYVAQVDYLNLQSANEFSLINSMFYCHNRCLAFGGRLEWWKSNQFQPESSSTYDFTLGANYRPKANILIRPEVRWDWGQNAVDNGDVVFGFDTIFTF